MENEIKKADCLSIEITFKSKRTDQCDRCYEQQPDKFVALVSQVDVNGKIINHKHMGYKTKEELKEFVNSYIENNLDGN